MRVEQEKIEQQRRMLMTNPRSVRLFAPCRIGEGILRLSDKDRAKQIKVFQQSKSEFAFFIPASGSGSRMFSFLFDILNNASPSDIGQVEKFMNHIQEFAFFQFFPPEWKQKIKDKSIDSDELSLFLLTEQGLNFASLPKGLIPFHYNEPFVLNPFQEHLLQGVKLSDGKIKFHFTVQEQFEQRICQSIASLEEMTGRKYDVSFSTQHSDMDSYAFSTDGELVLSDNAPIRRPAGHGALLSNLNEIDSPLIFIKNIDNVQHFSFSHKMIEEWSMLGGVLLNFRRELHSLFVRPSKQKLAELNEQYQFLSPEELTTIHNDEELQAVINRPIRICGVVKNDGQVGGGPFWVEDNGHISKQIVEKTQIAHSYEQVRLMIKSTHFNPVMIALSPYDLYGNKHDLTRFQDPNKYFTVTKTHKGQTIRYIEQPGLWNGSMDNWNSIFVEISSLVFSPVKNILDLLTPLHSSQKNDYGVYS